MVRRSGDRWSGGPPELCACDKDEVCEEKDRGEDGGGGEEESGGAGVGGGGEEGEVVVKEGGAGGEVEDTTHQAEEALLGRRVQCRAPHHGPGVAARLPVLVEEEEGEEEGEGGAGVRWGGHSEQPLNSP